MEEKCQEQWEIFVNFCQKETQEIDKAAKAHFALSEFVRNESPGLLDVDKLRSFEARVVESDAEVVRLAKARKQAYRDWLNCLGGDPSI